MDVGKGREQERKLFRRIWVVFAGNAGFRMRYNRLIPAYMPWGTVPSLALGDIQTFQVFKAWKV
ncbi:MAG TPA: hypothetical protein VIF10_00870 [Methylobacter sp.]|jgi:hypothetical protein